MSEHRHAVTPSPVGELTLVAAADRLVGVWFPQHSKPTGDLGNRVPLTADALLSQTAAQLAEYFAGQRREFTVPLRQFGDSFAERVWAQLLAIEYGTTTTYGAIAAAIGVNSAQAVGQAVGRNPLSIVVPCHRVVGADGSLTGFGGGLERKRLLLELEGVLAPEEKTAPLF